MDELIAKVKIASTICKEPNSTCDGCPYYGTQFCRCTLISDALKVINHLEGSTNISKPIKKFLFVEDGSVDIDELEESLEQTNPEIKVVVYRQGGTRPQLVDVEACE